MISKEVERLKVMQEEISDICDEIHNIINKDFKLLCNVLVMYEPNYDEPKLCMTLVYYNRRIAEYIYDLNSNKIGARNADFNKTDSNGNECNPLAMFNAFENDMRDKLGADVFLVAGNYAK